MTKDEAQRRRWTFYEAVKIWIATFDKSVYFKKQGR